MLHQRVKNELEDKPNIFAAYFKEFTKKFPSMSMVNKLLQDHSGVWTIVKHEFNMSPNCTLPEFEQHLLYGIISYVHNPELESIIVSDRSSQVFKDFFKELGRIIKPKLEYQEFEEIFSEMVPAEIDKNRGASPYMTGGEQKRGGKKEKKRGRQKGEEEKGEEKVKTTLGRVRRRER
jgi:hypothetical protein